MKEGLEKGRHGERYQVLCGKNFKDCGGVELNDKTIVDYLGFCREVFVICIFLL